VVGSRKMRAATKSAGTAAITVRASIEMLSMGSAHSAFHRMGFTARTVSSTIVSVQIR